MTLIESMEEFQRSVAKSTELLQEVYSLANRLLEYSVDELGSGFSKIQDLCEEAADEIKYTADRLVEINETWGDSSLQHYSGKQLNTNREFARTKSFEDLKGTEGKVEMVEEDVKVWLEVKEQLLLEQKIPIVEVPESIKAEIAQNRGNPDNVVAYTRDANGKLVWLESGTMFMTDKGEKGAGFWHIENRHYSDFQQKFGDGSYQEVIDRIINTVKNGECVESVDKAGRKSYVYETNTVKVYVGDNGFTIGSRPKSSN